ncbi:MAG: diacylglycerol kinase family lipid kinase [Chloroflexi bacterium]|nr:diacylglycerol kinase family lipid kinase [Chloroflexota bacterium]MCL5108317.1 diacylglycerol kinase family lipid kinase [Chloroflexota bacterium]MDA8218265.1 diacylglycerol kinase family lipid kinase [Dehalococcoidales bacterium]
MVRNLVIVNPVAGGGSSAKRWERAEPLLRQLGYDFEQTVTGKQGEAQALAAQAAARGYKCVVAVGGDGTVSEIVNGLLTETGVAGGGPRLGIVPTGRGVDLCRTLGIPLDYLEATRRLVDARTVAIDIGEAEYTAAGAARHCYFANFAGMGFDVEVSRRANTIAPRGGGTIPYLSSVFLCLLSFRNKRVEMVADGEVTRRRVASIIAANGQYFGGGMRIAPQASLTDGQFDVVILGDLSRPELVVNLPKIYEGTHVTHPKVDVFRARTLEVHSVEPVYFQVDGDPLGETPVKLCLHPAALQVVV